MATKQGGKDSPGTHPDIPSMTFEVALEELEGIVENLESGQVELQDSIDLYDRGVALRKHCESKLGEARERVDRVVGAGAGLEPVRGRGEKAVGADTGQESADDEDPPF